MFDPKLKIGQVVHNSDIVEIFKCGNMGGMRRSKTTNTLVIITDYTKGLYHDKWINGVLHYTGMGKSGDQDINWAQNATLAGCGKNNVDVHLFEVIDVGEYIYCGRIELVDKPYKDTQLGEDGVPRMVWMFPVRPVPDNDVKKLDLFVFSDMDDYNKRGKKADAEYIRLLKEKRSTKKRVLKNNMPQNTMPNSKATIDIPNEIIGKSVKHKQFGVGTIVEIGDGILTVKFDKVGMKKLGYELSVKNKLIEFIQ